MKVTYLEKDEQPTVELDDFDTWNMYETLSHIIHPMLVQLKRQQHGAPSVENEDVPEALWCPEGVESWEADEKKDPQYFARWDYVLNEMIWTFEQFTFDDVAQFHHHLDNMDMKFVPLEDKPEYTEIVFGKKDPNCPEHWFDKESAKAHEDRKTNGLRLFAKYYRNLWD